MSVPYFALALTAAFVLISAADGKALDSKTAPNIPKLDVTASCKGAAIDVKGDEAKATIRDCMVSESKAHDQLVEEWSQFTPTDRVKCVASVSGFEPTYSELVTCLEMERDVRNPPHPGVTTPPTQSGG